MRRVFALWLLCGCDAPLPTSAPDPIDLPVRELSTERHVAARDGLVAMGDVARGRVERLRLEARERGDAMLEERCRDVLDRIASMRCCPMDVGYRWTYQDDDHDVVFEVMRRTVVDGAPCFEVRRTVGTEKLAFIVWRSADGLAIVRAGEHRFDPPFLEIAFPLRVGAAWTWRGTIGGLASSVDLRVEALEVVTVPAGRFAAWHIVERHAGSENPTHLYVAENVGVVMLQGKDRDLHNSIERAYCWRLREFRRG